MKKIVIGGGASGLMAAYSAASHGHEVLLLEKNEKLGKKLYLTGKGRCNLTNACSPEEFLAHVVRGGRFLRSAAYRFPPEKVMALIEGNGVPVKVERGGRVFPVSDKASDVTAALRSACLRAGVKISLDSEAEEVLIEEGKVRGLRTKEGELSSDAVIVATGGLSYPSTGSTGDGYRFAERAGHTIIPPIPSLVGLNAEGFSAAQGVSLRNVVLTARRGKKALFSEMGELLLTHYGISGPLVLSLSAVICRMEQSELTLSIDLKPALDEKTLDERILRDLGERKNEQMKNVMRGLLPAGLTTIVLQEGRVSPEKQANALTREERLSLVHTLKELPVRKISLRGFSESVVTSGGVRLEEVDPHTMQSRLVSGLYFCGEVLDCDAFTGGYNLQIAFCTGYLAGIGAE